VTIADIWKDERLARLDASDLVRAIGNTPLVRLTRFAERHDIAPTAEIWLKQEWTNPGGSVKDRPALAIVHAAIASGQLAEGRTLIDATSGNTGIAYAMLGAALDFPVTLVVPGSASEERKRILAAYGAIIIESDPFAGSNGAIEHVRELVAADRDGRYYYADQYRNPQNPQAHFRTTGPEIWKATGGRLTHVVAGLGTTGTLMGVGNFLRLEKPDITVVGVQPSDSFHGIEGLKHLPTAIVPTIYDETVVDRQIGVETETAFDLARELARVEGLFVGTSTGAALAGALTIAQEATANEEFAMIVAVAPDNGSKYLSTELWSTGDPA